jgi:hypothetical protein
MLKLQANAAAAGSKSLLSLAARIASHQAPSAAATPAGSERGTPACSQAAGKKAKSSVAGYAVFRPKRSLTAPQKKTKASMLAATLGSVSASTGSASTANAARARPT